MLKDKKLIVFDLDDTLTASKQMMTEEISKALAILSKKYLIGIISGCNWEQMEKQVVTSLAFANALFENFYFLPTSGASMMRVDPQSFQVKHIYKNELTLKEKCGAIAAFNIARHEYIKKGGEFPMHEDDSWGEVAEDRVSQVTFSVLGQEAPIEAKLEWTKHYGQNRYDIADKMKSFLPTGLTVRVGGTTSLDVTRNGIDKAYGMKQLEKYAQIPLDQMFFVGDKLQQGGNDYPVKELGVDCTEVKNIDDTLQLLQEWNNGT